MIVFACISPHPPLILPTVGSKTDREKVGSTIANLESLAPRLALAKPEIIIVSSPHPDWGIEVPLYFLAPNLPVSISSLQSISDIKKNSFSKPNANGALPVFPLLTTLDSPDQHYQWGKKIGQVLSRDKRVAWIASGDMSHRLKEDGPYGFHPSGPKFDQEFIKYLKNKDTKSILEMDETFLEEAGECGLRSFCSLLGALEELRASWQVDVLSYEGPFGVGYLVAELEPAGV